MRPCDIKNIQTVKDQINNNKQWAAEREVMLLIRGKDTNIRVEASSRDPKQPGKAFGVLQAIVNKVNKEFFAGEQIMENPKNGLDFKFSNLTFTKPVLDKLQEVFRSTIKRDVEKNREITPRDIQGVLSNYKDSTISIKEGNEYVVNGEVYPTYGDALEASKKDDDLIFSTNGDIVSKEEQQANIKRLKEQFFPTSDTSSASKILSKIASSNHPLNQVAKHLMKYASINDVVVVLKDAEYFINSTNNIKGIGKYTFSKNRIDIAAKSGSIKIETLLLHEILHALSYRTLRNNTEYSKNFRKLYEKSKEKLGEFDDKSLQGEYANYTIDKFFVAIFTDSAFIKKLQSLEAINVQKYPNLFEEIIDYLLSILGFVSTDNLYSQAMAVASNIIQHEYDTQQYIIMENEYYDSLQEPLFSISEQQPSNNLDTASNNNEITEIDDSLYNSILNQLEQENIIKRDCNGKGRLKAEKGLQTNFNRGGKWKLIKDLKGYPTHKEGGVDLTIGKNGVIIKNGNTQFTAKHGLVIPKAQDGLVISNNPEYEAMSKVLSQRNKSLNWVERGLNPDKYGKIDNGDGTFSTHRLAYSTGDNGEAYVYPTIIQNDKGELEQLDDDAAWDYAMKTKTAMVVPNVKLAEYYSQNGLIKH